MRLWSTRRLRTAVVITAAALAHAACNAVDAVKHGFEHSKAVSAQLDASVGVKSAVGFNWNNGALTAVTVHFDGMPANHSLPEIVDLCREAVRKEFKQAPRQLVVSFAIAP